MVPASVPGRREAIEEIDSVRTLPLEVAQADGPVEETLALDTSGFRAGADAAG